jgi:hypothetical protein
VHSRIARVPTRSQSTRDAAGGPGAGAAADASPSAVRQHQRAQSDDYFVTASPTSWRTPRPSARLAHRGAHVELRFKARRRRRRRWPCPRRERVRRRDGAPFGERMRVTTQLVSTAGGKVLWDSVYEVARAMSSRCRTSSRTPSPPRSRQPSRTHEGARCRIPRRMSHAAPTDQVAYELVPERPLQLPDAQSSS